MYFGELDCRSSNQECSCCHFYSIILFYPPRHDIDPYLAIRVVIIPHRQVSTMTTSAVSSSRKGYVCGLKEVKKAIKLGEAKSIILAANIEQWELSNGNVDEQVADILKNGEEKVRAWFYCC